MRWRKKKKPSGHDKTCTQDSHRQRRCCKGIKNFESESLEEDEIILVSASDRVIAGWDNSMEQSRFRRSISWPATIGRLRLILLGLHVSRSQFRSRHRDSLHMNRLPLHGTGIQSAGWLRQRRLQEAGSMRYCCFGLLQRPFEKRCVCLIRQLHQGTRRQESKSRTHLVGRRYTSEAVATPMSQGGRQKRKKPVCYYCDTIHAVPCWVQTNRSIPDGWPGE